MARNKSTVVATDYVVTESDAPLTEQSAALTQFDRGSPTTDRDGAGCGGTDWL